MTDLERLTRDYWRAVQRVRRMAVPAHHKALVLADLEVIYRDTRAKVSPPVSPTKKPPFGGFS